MQKTVSVFIPIYGDLNKYLPFLQRSAMSVYNQSVKADVFFVSISDNLMDARNKAGLNANTDYIIFLDVDDELDLHYIENILKSDADIIVPSVHRVYEDGRIDTDQYWFTPIDLLERNYIVIGAAIKTSKFKEVNGFRDLECLEDWDFFIRAEEKGCTFEQSTNSIYKAHIRINSRNSNQHKTYSKILSEAKQRRGL